MRSGARALQSATRASRGTEMTLEILSPVTLEDVSYPRGEKHSVAFSDEACLVPEGLVLPVQTEVVSR